MFRKTWKTIKIFLIAGIVLICLPRSILPIQKSDSQPIDIDGYLKLNEKETRLIEFKDNEETLKLKLAQLEIINKSRKKFRADPVKLDILASRVANKMSREAAENEFTGHWNMAGEKPYHRYAFAGGYDHVSENAYGGWSSDNYDSSNSTIGEMMKSGHEGFMAERAPNDGHKKTVINKPHNFVGIGYYLTGKQFRYYEEYIDRYMEFENIPSELKVGEQSSITVKTNDFSYLYFVSIYRDKMPNPLTPAQIRRKGSYADFGDEEYKNLLAWDLSRYRNGPTYKIPLLFTKEGYYYIQIYTDKKELTKPTSLDTKGKSPVSGIVIKVTR